MHRFKFLILLMIPLGIGLALFYGYYYVEVWPEPNGKIYAIEGEKALKKFHLLKIPIENSMDNYSAKGKYLHVTLKSFGSRKLDKEGFPLVRYGSEYQYNPLAIAQFVLAVYNDEYLTSGKTDALIKAANKLISMQSPDGAFRYSFKWRHYTNNKEYEKGWISGMAQGQALSAFARAYIATGDKRYLIAGEKALAFLSIPKEKGGPRTNMADLRHSLYRHIFFFEYKTYPNVYTLNGYMFILLGLYDWAEVAKSEIARNFFNEGMITLEHILPYYDLGTYTSYDLSYITHKDHIHEPMIAVPYHPVHIYLLQALSSIRPRPILVEYRDKWFRYVKP